MYLGSGTPLAEHFSSNDCPSLNITELLASFVMRGGIAVKNHSSIRIARKFQEKTED